jgi:putative transposase
VLGVSRSGFHAWQRRLPSDRQLSDAWLVEKIRVIHSSSRGTYGSPRVHAELRFNRISVGRKRVERLMREQRLSGLVRRRRGRTTIRVPGVRVANDLVGRDFSAPAPNRLWVADITYLRTWEGWLYLAAVVDCYSRRVVGWSIADHMRAELVVDALEMAVNRRRPEPALCTTATRDRNTSRWRSGSAAAKPGSSYRWEAAAAPTTTPSAKPSSRP